MGGVDGSKWERMGVGGGTVWYNLFYYCVFYHATDMFTKNLYSVIA